MAAKLIYQLTITFALLAMVHSYTQEIFLYENETEEGNYFYFSSNMPDTSSYPLHKVKRGCYRGQWALYRGANYASRSVYRGSEFDDELHCYNANFTAASFRHLGASDTTQNALSLYTGWWFELEETYITQGAASGLEGIQSFAITGSSNWTLFQGPNFDGERVCMEGATPPQVFIASAWNLNNLTINSIGSVFRGCDFQKN